MEVPKVSRLPNSLRPGQGRPGETTRFHLVAFGSVAKVAPFASDIEKFQEGLFHTIERSP
jgi:hypothetical protein